MELHVMVENLWKRSLENYLFMAHAVGRETDVRKALDVLVKHVNSATELELFKLKGPEKDDRYFVIELEGVRVATFYHHNQPLEVSVMPQITPSIFDTIDTFMNNAIKYASLLYAHDAMKRVTDPLVSVIDKQHVTNLAMANLFHPAPPALPKEPEAQVNNFGGLGV